MGGLDKKYRFFHASSGILIHDMIPVSGGDPEEVLGKRFVEFAGFVEMLSEFGNGVLTIREQEAAG